MNSIGILTGGGIGRALAHWIAMGKPDMDVTGMNVNRGRDFQMNPLYRRNRTEESLGLVYKCHYPNYSNTTARGVKKSPFHDRLAAAGACFKEVSGWESPDWFAPAGVEPTVEKLSWGKESYFPFWQQEHQACREAVILMDMSFMSKFSVEGRDAGKLLSHLSANQVNFSLQSLFLCLLL